MGEDGETALGDLIAGDGPSIEDYVSTEMGSAAPAAGRRHPARERADRDHAPLRHSTARSPQALRETGRRLGLSSERVRQLEDQALRRLSKDDSVAALREAA